MDNYICNSHVLLNFTWSLFAMYIVFMPDFSVPGTYVDFYLDFGTNHKNKN